MTLPEKEGDWKLHVKEASVNSEGMWPKKWKCQMVVIDEIGSEMGHYTMENRQPVYSEKQLTSEQRKDILSSCVRNKAGAFVIMYRCAVNAVGEIMCAGADVSCSTCLRVKCVNVHFANGPSLLVIERYCCVFAVLLEH